MKLTVHELQEEGVYTLWCEMTNTPLTAALPPDTVVEVPYAIQLEIVDRPFNGQRRTK